jgi:hypothetical protein
VAHWSVSCDRAGDARSAAAWGWLSARPAASSASHCSGAIVARAGARNRSIIFGFFDRDAGLLPDGLRGADDAGRPQPLAELRGVGGEHFQGGGQELGVTAAAVDRERRTPSCVSAARTCSRSRSRPTSAVSGTGSLLCAPRLFNGGNRSASPAATPPAVASPRRAPPARRARSPRSAPPGGHPCRRSRPPGPPAPRMQAHPDPDRHPARPVVPPQRPLGRHAARHRVAGRGEDHEETIPLGPHLQATAAGDGGADQRRCADSASPYRSPAGPAAPSTPRCH